MLASEVAAEDLALGRLAEQVDQAAATDAMLTDCLLMQLLSQAQLHFVHEEQWLAEHAYPMRFGHAALHAQMKAELEHALLELRSVSDAALRTAYGLLVRQLVEEHSVRERIVLCGRKSFDQAG